MRAREIMSEAAFWVSSSATVYDAAKLLVNSRASALPVIDENGSMVGILSEADILKGPLAAAKTVGTETLGRPEDDAYAVRHPDEPHGQGRPSGSTTRVCRSIRSTSRPMSAAIPIS